MLARGVKVSAGTDATRVASYNPWVSLSWMVTGKTVGGTRLYPARNCLDRETALRMWTENVAWFSNEEGKRGRIEPGQLADFIVPDKDYFSCAEDEISFLTSDLTVVGGASSTAPASSVRWTTTRCRPPCRTGRPRACSAATPPGAIRMAPAAIRWAIATWRPAAAPPAACMATSMRAPGRAGAQLGPVGLLRRAGLLLLGRVRGAAMNTPSAWERRLAGAARPLFGSAAIRFLAYLGLCAAYLQGGLVKLTDFPGALREMAHFGLSPAPVYAVLVIALELIASAMILTGRLRWLGAAALALFTLAATGMALRFWELPVGQERFMAANAFFEHLGLAGGFLLVAWLDLKAPGGAETASA